VIYRPDVQLSKASSVRTMRTFRLDLPLCREASNCSSLHLSGRFNNIYGRHSMFDQLWDFVPKHRYRKTTATVWTMWIPVWTSSSIRQVAHSRFRRPDDGIHGSDARASYMEIAFIWFTVWTIGKHRSDAAQFRKEFLRNLESRLHSGPSGRLMPTVWTAPRYFKPDAHLNL
jgi:hypothetical protein